MAQTTNPLAQTLPSIYVNFETFSELLVPAGHLCDLQGLFSEIDSLCRMNRNGETWRWVFAETNNL